MTSGQTVTLPTSVTGTIKPETACGTLLAYWVPGWFLDER